MEPENPRRVVDNSSLVHTPDWTRGEGHEIGHVVQIVGEASSMFIPSFLTLPGCQDQLWLGRLESIK